MWPLLAASLSLCASVSAASPGEQRRALQADTDGTADGMVTRQTVPISTCTAEVEQVGAFEADGRAYVSFRLYVGLQDSAATNVYAIYGESAAGGDLPIIIPAAFQVSPPWGADFGGIDQELARAAAAASVQHVQYDSWLTIGLDNGDPGHLLAMTPGFFPLAAEEWGPDQALRLTNAAIFYMDPDLGPTDRRVLLAQLSCPADLPCSTTLNVRGRYATAPNNWDQTQLVFAASLEPAAEPAGPVHDDSCDQAHDGFCDEPYECDTGTDTTDCSQEGFEEGNNKYCRYASDGECDEIQLCPAGSDTFDCCLNGVPRETDSAGKPVVAADVCCGGDCLPPGADWCQFANDGSCDEPPLGYECPPGTDTTDCSAAAEWSCQYSDDNDCDEGPDAQYCLRGTDFNDCCEAVGVVKVFPDLLPDNTPHPRAGQVVAGNADCSQEAFGRVGHSAPPPPPPPPSPEGPNSCIYANDDECDERESTLSDCPARFAGAFVTYRAICICA